MAALVRAPLTFFSGGSHPALLDAADTSGADGVIELGEVINGTDGFRLSGAAIGDYAGLSVSSAGDVNGDGFDDVIVGAYGADPNGNLSGAAYVVFGKADGFAVNTIFSTLDGENGFAVKGAAAGDFAGYAVSGGGDINGDGFADLLVSAREASEDGHAGAGASYIIFGHKPLEAVTRSGTAIANTIHGSDFADTLSGPWRQATTSIGHNGADSLLGGLGNDRLTGGVGRDVMTGGANADTFDFNTVGETGKTAATRDRIVDFSHPQHDHIDLSTIDANGAAPGNKFIFLAGNGAAFTGVKGQLHWFQQNPAGTAHDKTIVEGDINGDKHADFQIELSRTEGAHGRRFPFVIAPRGTLPKRKRGVSLQAGTRASRERIRNCPRPRLPLAPDRTRNTSFSNRPEYLTARRC